MSDEPDAEDGLVVTSVRCLDCGHAYAKPAEGGTTVENPGCPRCGYIGWVPASVEVTEPPRSRSAADPQPHRAERLR